MEDRSIGSGSWELSVCDEDNGATDSGCGDDRMSRDSSLAASDRLRTTFIGSACRLRSPMGSDCLLRSFGASTPVSLRNLSDCVSSSSVSAAVGDSLRGSVAKTLDSGLNGEPSSEETSSPAASTSSPSATEDTSVAWASVEKSEWIEESTCVPTSERLLIVSSYLYFRCGVAGRTETVKGQSQPATVELQSMRQLVFLPK